MAMGERSNGEFCWVNVLTPQPAAAQEFFTRLFGWAYVEIPGIGHRVQVDGHDIGGMWDHGGPEVPAGTPPGIGVMVRVASADATVARVTELGGTAKPAFDIMDQGRMAECHDPIGAMFDLWQPNKSPGMTADSRRQGVPNWFELISNDPPRTAAFYTALFGWTTEEMPMPYGTYTTFKLGDRYVGGMFAMTPEMGDMPPHWGTYFSADDADATARLAVELGGEVFMPIMEVAGVGRFGGITSPQGVMFYVITEAAR
jgi:hypothetical protein